MSLDTPPTRRHGTRIVVPRGTVAQQIPKAKMPRIMRKPAATRTPQIWLWRKHWDTSYPEAGGNWKLIDLKQEAGMVHELWQWIDQQ